MTSNEHEKPIYNSSSEELSKKNIKNTNEASNSTNSNYLLSTNTNENKPFNFADFYRINFIGRPTELRKLVEDKYTFLTSRKDANRVIVAHRLYYGWQYFGNILALANYLIYIRLSKKYSLSNRTHILSMMLGLSPILVFYFYSHFSYWDIIRPVVFNSRDISRKLKENVVEIESSGSSETFNKDEFQIFFNKNCDLHSYVVQNLSMSSCLKEIFGLNKKLLDN